MSVERAIYAFWIAQGIAVLVIVLWDLRRHDWFRVAGVAAGLAVILGPTAVKIIFNVNMPAAFAIAVSLVASPIILIVCWGLAKRWVLFILAVIFLGGPIAYLQVHSRLFPTASDPFFEKIVPLVELQFFLTPILAALAGRELFALIGKRFPKERAA